MKKIGLLARFSLLAATLIWGTSFVIIKDAVDLISPNYLMAVRFTGAFVLLSVIFRKRLSKINSATLLRSTVIGVFLYLAYIFQTYGIMYTTPGKNAFLTAFYCVLVPFLAWGVKGPRPDRWNLLAAFMCVAGIGLISLDGNLNIGKGDLLTLVGGFFFACHMVAVSEFSGERDPVVITILQFAAAAVCFWITTFVIEGGPAAISLQVMPSVIYLCLFCTAAALLLQNFGQKHVTPSAASLLLSLEAVFGALISALMGREEFSGRMLCGFCVVFLSVVVSETKLSFLKEKMRVK